MRRSKETLILRLRLREMTIDGFVNGGGPWIVAKKGRKFLGSAALGGCTKIYRETPDQPYCVVECHTIQLILERCDEAEIQAVSTAFGIPGRIEFYGDYKNRPIFPYAPKYLFESPFWDAMQACAAEDPKRLRAWGIEDDRTGMRWREGLVRQTAAQLLLRSSTELKKAWGYEIDVTSPSRFG